jgi:hypothetical protein
VEPGPTLASPASPAILLPGSDRHEERASSGKQRLYLALFVARFHYEQIVRLCGATYTNI